MKDIGRIIKSMVKEFINIKMEILIKENLDLTKKMVRDV